MSEHSLDLLGLPLVDGLPDEEHGYEFAVYGDETRFGVATSAQEIVTSLLADGDLVRITRFGNREVSFPVEIAGPTLGSLAHGEAALRSVVGRGGDLVWQPPDVLAVPTAFDVITSSMEFRFDDLGGELRKRRVFMVTLTCLPFGRSLSAVVVAAQNLGGATTSVDTCASSTGWSASSSASGSITVAASSGALTATDSTVTSLSMTRTGTVDLTTQKYLTIEARGLPADGLNTIGLSTPAGKPIAPRVAIRAMDNGFSQITWDCTDWGSVPTLRFLLRRTLAASMTFTIREVYKSASAPQVSPRQISRFIQVGGTERTPASIHLQTASGSGSLGQVIVHTCPDDGSGYSPPLRRWRTSASTGPVTLDATLYSGGREPIAFASGGFYAEVPTSALPAGGYTLVARVRLTATPPASVTIFYSTSTIFPGGTAQEGFTNGSQVVTLTDTNWALVPVATLSLPSVRTSAGKVQIVLQSSTTHAQVDLDEAWLFREDDDCALTIVDTARPHLWLDSPDATSPVPTVWMGDGSSTRVHPGTGLKAMGSHVLSPEGTAVFTAALSDNPATDGTFYRRWHTNAAS